LDYSTALELLRARGNEVQQMHLGLHRIRRLMEALGNPHESFRALHIAGTNGKGSVAAMAEAILRASGSRTGLYTSPHLVRLEERIRIAGRQVSPRRLAALATTIHAEERRLLRAKQLDRPLTYFELLTAFAFVHFAQQKVDMAVIEVGLGGLLDATNIVRPSVSVITGIAMDHEAFLGDTLEKIAAEKAGILKPGVPAVTACRPRSALRVLREHAQRVGAPLSLLQSECAIRIVGERRGRVVLDLETPVRRYKGLRLSLAGVHQAVNAALAVRAVELAGMTPSAGAVRQALGSASWPGRLDEYRARRLTLLDGAHNPEGATLLRRHLEKLQRRPVHLVFGAMSDKKIAAMGRAVFPVAHRIHLTPVATARSATPAEIAALLPRYASRMRLHENSAEALNAAWESCTPNGLVAITGSLYLVGELLEKVRSDEMRQRTLRRTKD
jgi:dihydrofolate synthase/folylpolyglutamate synthase